MPAKRTRPACGCGCGQPSYKSERLRKASCSCGASIMRVSRVALGLIVAECRECGSSLDPDCLFDRLAAGDRNAPAELARLGSLGTPLGYVMPGRERDDYRCGDCSAKRAASGPCRKCRSERPPTTTYMHPRAARARGGDMPF